MANVAGAITDLSALVLLVGFVAAGVADVRRREVSDRVWQVLGAGGIVLGGVALAPDGLRAVLLWLLVAGLALEHFVSWDLWLGERWEAYANLIELGGYAGVLLLVVGAAVRFGVGPGGVPLPAVAVLAMVLFARGLFELRVLYGAADAKALIAAAVLIPLWPAPWLYAPTLAAPAAAVLPFGVALLANTALLSISVPVALAALNVARGDFSLPEGFLGYYLPVEELPRRYVWVKDPAAPEARDDAETTEDDDRLRAETADRLAAKGVRRVWVTPQIPLVALMALGAVAGLLAGNLLLDLLLRL